MIDISKINTELEVFSTFTKLYIEATENDQDGIEAIAISSFDKNKHLVNSRYVNIKYIIDDEFIFFTNFLSPKANEFSTHNQVSCIFFWRNTNVQIRIQGIIKKCSESFSDQYFKNRSIEKNALAICSKQSAEIESYSALKNSYLNSLENENCKIRPKYWGGYSIKPYLFEFWRGAPNRLNKRKVYEYDGSEWTNKLLSP